MKENVKKPVGVIGLYAHKPGGKFDFKTQSIVGAETIKSKVAKNLIVDMASVFMAQRMVPGASWGNGIQYLAVGTGVGTGTTANPEVENPVYTKLRNEIDRVGIDSWTYLDESGKPTETPTKSVQYVFKFLTTEGVGGLVEMGMFGGDASTGADTGHLFNYKVFPIWNKTDDIELTVSWKITF